MAHLVKSTRNRLSLLKFCAILVVGIVAAPSQAEARDAGNCQKSKDLVVNIELSFDDFDYEVRTHHDGAIALRSREGDAWVLQVSVLDSSGASQVILYTLDESGDRPVTQYIGDELVGLGEWAIPSERAMIGIKIESVDGLEHAEFRLPRHFESSVGGGTGFNLAGLCCIESPGGSQVCGCEVVSGYGSCCAPRCCNFVL